MKKKNKILKVILYSLIIILYTLLVSYIALKHESWRDEAQAWLIARDLSFIDIIKQMVYEGHPFLWHYILKIFIIIGFPYKYISFISIMVMAITASIILKKAPFNIFSKIIIIFSLPFIYTYSIVARSYCLVALSIILIASNYKDRHIHPIKYLLSILLLLNSHVIMYGMVGILLLLFYLEEIFKYKNKSKKRIAFIIASMLACIIVIVFVCYPIFLGYFNVSLLKEYTPSKAFFILMRSVSYEIFNTSDKYYILLFIYFILFLIYLFFKNYKNLLILFISVVYQAIIYHTIYYSNQQRLHSLIFIFIFIFWINKYEKKIKKFDFVFSIVGFIILITTTYNGSYIIDYDLKYNYSSSKQTAIFIDNNIKKGSTFITNGCYKVHSIIPYLSKNDYKFYSLPRKDYFTYEVWDHRHDSLDINYIEKFLKNSKNDIYFICAGKCNFNSISNFEFIFESEKSKEYFEIYKINRYENKNQLFY